MKLPTPIEENRCCEACKTKGKMKYDRGCNNYNCDCHKSNQEKREKVCDKCLAHYIGDHECSPLMRTLKENYDKKHTSQNTVGGFEERFSAWLKEQANKSVERGFAYNRHIHEDEIKSFMLSERANVIGEVIKLVEDERENSEDDDSLVALYSLDKLLSLLRSLKG